MHIPDGYLSPGTCATLYAAAAPFWLLALNRVKRAFAARSIPLLALFSALSFTVMMFNVPLPGGTTGHAVGIGMATVVLGPWFSLLAISTALFIQALLFGDGGITTFGANCFNMAVVGSLVCYVVYRLLAFRAPLLSTRRALSAGLGGYCGINAAAFCAAIEFGIQPLYFHDAAGTPLYAPYGLNVTIPAMMIGHFTIAGLAEFALSAGVIAYLQRTDPSLLGATTTHARVISPASEERAGVLPRPRFAFSRLWIIAAILLVLTPIGVVATGNAWGEWSSADYTNPQSRNEIAAVSGNHALPRAVPRGLERLSGLWTAPLSGYAPKFIPNRYAGYLISALAGIGFIAAFTFLAVRLVPHIFRRRSPARKTFLELTIERLTTLSEESIFAEQGAAQRGLLQRLDPRVKLAGLGALVLTAIAVRQLSISAALFAVTLLLPLSSGISFKRLIIRVLIPVLAFTGVIAVPALFLTRGPVLWTIPNIQLPLTEAGLHSAAFLIVRALTSATLVSSLLLTTPWNRLLRALRFFRVPRSLIVIIEMAYRYIWILLRSAKDLFESRRARSLGPLTLDNGQQVVSSAAGTLLDKSLGLSGEVFLAMQARGFRGEVVLLNDAPLAISSWAQLGAIVALAASIMYAGR